MKHNEDQGDAFGRWPNKTARLMYHDIMPLALNGIDTTGRVVDLGGANGLRKEWIPQVVTVDYDESKSPDIVEDICTHVGEYDLAILRYVLHYMPDVVALDLLRHIREYHKGRLLVIQFVNDDYVSKAANSIGEVKWFRNTVDTVNLFATAGWRVASAKAVDYIVDADFYRERLNHPNPSSHVETILILELAH